MVEDTVSLITVALASNVVLITILLSSLLCTPSIFTVAVSVVVVVMVLLVLTCNGDDGFVESKLYTLVAVVASNALSTAVSGVGKMAVFP